MRFLLLCLSAPCEAQATNKLPPNPPYEVYLLYIISMASKNLKPLYWIDAHFCGLRAQTNIYGLSKVIPKQGLPKLFAATINGYFISLEYQYQKLLKNRLIPITREDVFFGPGIGAMPQPGGDAEIFEIVSVDVMCNAGSKENIMLAVSYLKLATNFEQKSPSAQMSIYFLSGDDDDSPNHNFVDAIAQANVQTFSLDFTPFKLMHETIYQKDHEPEIGFLLGGNDNKIHVYRQSQDDFSFFEETNAVEEFFPEFASIDSCVTQMEFRQVDETTRLSVLGLQNGLVTLSMVNVYTKDMLMTRKIELDSPITSVHLFTQFTNATCPDFLDVQDYQNGSERDSVSRSEEINLLVTSAVDPSMVFCDVVHKGLSKGLRLPYSNTRDVVLCSCVMDIDFDGENEILIGTYGQMLLAYKFIPERPPPLVMTSTPFQSPLPVSLPVPDCSSASVLSQTESEKLQKSETSFEQEKADNRRRHKSVAALHDNSGGSNKHDRHRSDEINALLDASLKDNQTSRLVKSQENLSPSSRSVYFSTPDHLISSEMTLPNGGFADNTEYPCYRLTWSKRFADPVMGMTCDDVMGDGMLDLVVLTLKGLHVLQPDLNEVAQLVLERMRLLLDPGSEADDDYHQLQKESLDSQ